MNSVESYQKQVSSMRYWLLGSQFHVALDAFEFAREMHDGLRKDGISPEFSHQMFIAQYARTILAGVQYPEETLAAIFLHDICEDYDVSFNDIEKRFGVRIREAVELLTKKKDGVRIPDDVYYQRLAADPIASLVKGLDRAHNIFTMSDAGWTVAKQREYLALVDDLLLPMLKVARRKFSKQEAAFENVKALLKIQAKHIRMNLDLIEERDNEASPALSL